MLSWFGGFVIVIVVDVFRYWVSCLGDFWGSKVEYWG